MQKTARQTDAQQVSMLNASIHKEGRWSHGSVPSVTIPPGASSGQVQATGYRLMPGWSIKAGPCHLTFLESVATEVEERNASPHYLAVLSDGTQIIQATSIQDFGSLTSYAKDMQPLVALLSGTFSAFGEGNTSKRI